MIKYMHAFSATMLATLHATKVVGNMNQDGTVGSAHLGQLNVCPAAADASLVLVSGQRASGKMTCVRKMAAAASVRNTFGSVVFMSTALTQAEAAMPDNVVCHSIPPDAVDGQHVCGIVQEVTQHQIASAGTGEGTAAAAAPRVLVILHAVQLRRAPGGTGSLLHFVQHAADFNATVWMVEESFTMFPMDLRQRADLSIVLRQWQRAVGAVHAVLPVHTRAAVSPDCMTAEYLKGYSALAVRGQNNDTDPAHSPLHVAHFDAAEEANENDGPTLLMEHTAPVLF